MALSLIGVPDGTEVISQIIEKTLSNGMLVEVYLVMCSGHYESALFIEGNYKPGPPLPRLAEGSAGSAAYWMGVRPKVGLTQEEGEEILGAVNVQNKLHHCFFNDTWGKAEI